MKPCQNCNGHGCLLPTSPAAMREPCFACNGTGSAPIILTQKQIDTAAEHVKRLLVSGTRSL